jgi:hypothetical protein
MHCLYKVFDVMSFKCCCCENFLFIVSDFLNILCFILINFVRIVLKWNI